MRAAKFIKQIKELPTNEQVPAVKFIAEEGSSITRRKFSDNTGSDRLPVIRANCGTTTETRS